MLKASSLQRATCPIFSNASRWLARRRLERGNHGLRFQRVRLNEGATS